MTKRDDVDLLIAMLAAAFNKEADTVVLGGYWMGLEDISIEKISGAVKRGCRECKFMPSIAELRELAGVRPVHARFSQRELKEQRLFHDQCARVRALQNGDSD